MKSFEEKLAAVSAEWVTEGLIGAETRSALVNRHPVGESAGANRLLGILAGVGVAMLFTGVSLLIKANWERLADWVKIVGLVGLLLGSYVVGWRGKVSPGRSPRMGDAFLMAGAVFFLLGIALVSQVFHLDSRPSNGVFLWWVGIAAVPWLTRAKGAQFVSVVAGLTWLGLEFRSDGSWMRLVDRAGYWRSDDTYLFAVAGFLVGAMLFLLGTGLRVGKRADFAGLHEMLGLMLMGWSLYVLGFTWSNYHWSRDVLQPMRWLPGALLVSGFLGTALWVRRLDRAAERRLRWLIAPGLVPVIAWLLGLDFVVIDSAWGWGGLACLALFALSFGMIRVGTAEGRESWINLGIAGIALNIITRYFLLFGTMLDGGMFFIVTGLLVIGLGYGLERKRRALVGAVRQGGNS